MDFDILFRDFTAVIAERRGIMTEDLVRYYFFACMLRQDPVLNHYTLEYPYSKISKKENPYISLCDNHELDVDDNPKDKELDLFYDDGLPDGICICVEIKFHRKSNGSGKESPTTANAGSLFNDMRRLQVINASKKLFRLLVYVTDQEMHDYLGNKKKESNQYRTALKGFYDLAKSKSINLSFPTSDGSCNAGGTFMTAASESFSQKAFFSVNIQSIFIIDMTGMVCPSFSGNNCHIRVYEVLDSNSKQEAINV